MKRKLQAAQSEIPLCAEEAQYFEQGLSGGVQTRASLDNEPAPQKCVVVEKEVLSPPPADPLMPQGVLPGGASRAQPRYKQQNQVNVERQQKQSREKQTYSLPPTEIVSLKTRVKYILIERLISDEQPLFMVHREGDDTVLVLKYVQFSEVIPQRWHLLENEVYLARKIGANHKSILKYYDAWVQDAATFIVMEKADQDLLTFLRERQGAISLKDVVQCLHSAALAVRQLHRLRYAHGDLKLDNFFVVGGKIKLGDLEFALNRKRATFDVQQRFVRFQCSDWRAPEQLSLKYGVLPRSGTPDVQKCDMYSFGVIVYNAVYWKRLEHGAQHDKNLTHAWHVAMHKTQDFIASETEIQNRLWQLILNLTSDSSEARGDAANLVNSLKTMMEI